MQRHQSLYENFKQKTKKIKTLAENLYSQYTYKPVTNKIPSSITTINPNFQERQDEFVSRIKEKEKK